MFKRVLLSSLFILSLCLHLPRHAFAVPAAITNLSGLASTTTRGSIVLTWTAPSDGGSPAAGYDLRVATSTFTDAAWDALWVSPVLGEPAPSTPGTTQTMTVSSLASGVTYYFRMKSSNASQTMSSISNNPIAWACAPFLASTLYDVSIDTGVTRWAYESTAADITTPVAGTGFITEQYTGMAYDDASHGVSSGTASQIIAQRYLFKIAQSTPTITKLSVYWKGWNEAELGVGAAPSFYIWDYNSGTPGWVLIGTGSGSLSDQELSGQYTTNINYYISNSSCNLKLTCPDPGSTAKRSRIHSNYVKLTVTYSVVADTIAPAAITNLAGAMGPLDKQVTLSWTAPGNDGSSGNNGPTAAYEVRYATFGVTADTSTWWNGGYGALSTYTQNWPVQFQGVTENKLLTMLTSGTTFWFAIQTTDGSGNMSAVTGLNAHMPVKVASGGEYDGVPPAAISDLTALSGGNSAITLHWTSPGDNGIEGDLTNGARFIIKYSTVGIITASNFNSPPANYAVTSVEISTATTAMTAQSRTFTGLTDNVTYWFAIKTEDAEMNWSSWASSADVAVANTLAWRYNADVTPPAAISALTAIFSGINTVKLTWTSPGDDGMDGNLQAGSMFRIKYSSKAIITNEIFDSPPADYAVRTIDISTAATLLSVHTTTFPLMHGVTYWFSIKTMDNVGNWSVWHSSAEYADINQLAYVKAYPVPQTITSLYATAISTASGTIRLTWTVPSFAGSYDIRTATSPFDNTQWDALWIKQIIGEPIPASTGTVQSMPIAGFLSNTTYYFRMKTKNIDDFESTLSSNPIAYAFTSATNIIGVSAGFQILDNTFTSPAGGTSFSLEQMDGIAVAGDELDALTENLSFFLGQRYEYTINASTESIAGFVLKWRGSYGSEYLEAIAPLGIWDFIDSHWDNLDNILCGETSLDSYDITASIGRYLENSVIHVSVNADNGNIRCDYTVLELTYETIVDSVAPAAITDLSAETGDNAAEVLLCWTAPGDNGVSGNNGPMASYEVRYATFGVSGDTSTWWNGGYGTLNAYVQNWPVLNQGTAETHVVTMPTSGQSYWFGVQTIDTTGNASGITGLNSASPVLAVSGSDSSDTTAPAGVSDLTALDGGPQTVILQWTSPGDEGASGNLITGSMFRIKYSSVAIITAADFDSPPAALAVQTITISTTATALSTQGRTITGLQTGIYWFAIKTMDESGNWSVWNSSGDVGTVNTLAWCTVSDTANTTPNTPSDLALYTSTTTWAALATGGWTNYQHIAATFTLTDPDAGDTLQYHIQFSTYADFSYNYVNSTAPATATLEDGATYYISPPLPEGTWYWRVRALDNTGYASAFASMTAVGGIHFGIDATAPQAITTLAAVSGFEGGVINLSWTAPGDDGAVNSISGGAYRVRYATYVTAAGDYWTDASANWTDWANKYEVNWSTGTGPLVPQTRALTGLTGGVTYYIRVWARDEIAGSGDWDGNWCSLSNGATTYAQAVLLDVNAQPDIALDLGEVATRATKILASSYTVINTGNVRVKYRLQLTGVPGAWTVKETPGATAGYDQIKLLALFTTMNPPASGDFTDDVATNGGGDIVRASTYDVATSSSFAVAAEDASVKGYGCTVGAERRLWFRFDAPWATDVITEQYLTVTVTAVQD